jgi:hypothetical protein
MNPLETYFRNLHEIRASGAGVKETSYYGTLETLLNEIGKTLKPRVRCIIALKDRGAGLPDGGLFQADRFSKNRDLEPFTEVLPERGVIEIKGTGDEVTKIADGEQVRRYLDHYGQVLVTNYRDFLLLGKDDNGRPVKREAYSLAPSESDFWCETSNPSKFASEQAGSFLEYLKRVLLQAAPISSPSDVAWFLASYARDARSRLERHSDLPELQNIRQALENALGIKFEAERGDRFFRSTLVQTLFYGVFSAWVLWHKENPDRDDCFDWRSAAHYLHVPMLSALFHSIAAPNHLKTLGLIEVLNWTGAALNRVRRGDFFRQFDAGQAVQYFYEPFLQAFDPDLRKELGVWYTPPEIVRYMVARVDRVLREELNIEDGLANPDVYILDPCCGTGAYLVEVLRYISEILQENGAGALAMARVKETALKRLFGFEILTAPFVVAHLQLGLFLQSLGVPLKEDNERVGVYLTNALTGWEPPNEEGKKKIQQLELSFPELNKEREAADKVKQGKPILVILGNPPYNAFAGTAEEPELLEVYKEGLISKWKIKKFNLDELYVRFVRLAERCISESTKKGVICYISSFSYLSDPSFVVMREKLLQNFDKFWFDCLNGDSRETGKLTPEGKPDPSIFSTKYNKAGIKLGTTIGLMVRKYNRSPKPEIYFRDFWGVNKRKELLESLISDSFDTDYKTATPSHYNRLSFRPSNVSPHYLEWPMLTELCKESPFNGPYDARNGALYAITQEQLIERIQNYFNVRLSHDQIAHLYPDLMKEKTGYDPTRTREELLKISSFDKTNIYSIYFKPFDRRYYYCELKSSLCCRPSPSLMNHVHSENNFLVTRDHGVSDPEGTPITFSKILVERDQVKGHARLIPFLIYSSSNKALSKKQFSVELFDTLQFTESTPKANLSVSARQYLNQFGVTDFDNRIENASLIWYHALAIGYSPLYLSENADGIRDNFPRIPLPNSKELLLQSAKLGKAIAALLDTENPVKGVTSKPTQDLKAIALISRVGGGHLNPDAGDLEITAGWGHGGKNGVTMPGKGKAVERNYTPEEIAVIPPEKQILLGQKTYDIYLNDRAYWKNIPSRVWEYTIGGYQVIKKWLSYREEKLLGRGLTLEEVEEVTAMTRRIAAIVFLESELDDNYRAIRESVYPFDRGERAII